MLLLYHDYWVGGPPKVSHFLLSGMAGPTMEGRGRNCVKMHFSLGEICGSVLVQTQPRVAKLVQRKRHVRGVTLQLPPESRVNVLEAP